MRWPLAPGSVTGSWGLVSSDATTNGRLDGESLEVEGFTCAEIQPERDPARKQTSIQACRFIDNIGLLPLTGCFGGKLLQRSKHCFPLVLSSRVAPVWPRREKVPWAGRAGFVPFGWKCRAKGVAAGVHTSPQQPLLDAPAAVNG